MECDKFNMYKLMRKKPPTVSIFYQLESNCQRCELLFTGKCNGKYKQAVNILK